MLNISFSYRPSSLYITPIERHRNQNNSLQIASHCSLSEPQCENMFCHCAIAALGAACLTDTYRNWSKPRHKSVT